MNKKNMLLSVVLALLLAILLVGCEGQDIEDNAGLITDANDVKNAADNGKENNLMKEFNDIVTSDNEPYTIVEFLDKNIKDTNAIEAITMISRLEGVQEDYVQRYTDELFKDDHQIELLKISGNDLFFDKAKIEEIKNVNTKELVEKIFNGEYKLINNEGAFYPIVDYESIKKYNDFVPDEARAYIDIKSLDSNKPSVLDGAITIPFSELGERLIKIESYISEYPVLLEFEQILKVYGQYLNLYLQGTDNTPIYDFQTKIIKEEVLSSYKSISSLDNSITGNVIEKYVEIIKENENVIDESILSKMPEFYCEAVANIEKLK